MRNKQFIRIITAALILCMFLSVAPALAFGEDGGEDPAPDKIPTVATWTFNADGEYKDIDNPYYPCYYRDGNPHSPTVEVTYTDDDGVTHTLEAKSDVDDMDYDYQVKYVNISVAGWPEITREECTGIWPLYDKESICYMVYVSMNTDGNYATPENSTEHFYIVRKSFNIVFYANYEGANPSSDYYGTIYWKENLEQSRIPVFTREGYTFDGWYQDAECTVPFDVNAPFNYNDVNFQGMKEVYAKWVKDESSGGDPTPGGDEPTPGGDGTDDTEGGGKPVPNTGVENMIPLFMWLLAASGLIIYSIRKKRA